MNINIAEIISETPEKTKRRKNFKEVIQKFQNNVKSYEKHSQNHELYVTRNENDLFNEQNYRFSVNSKYRSPYVFYEISEILKFTEISQPQIQNIKTIGMYTRQRHNGHCLLEHKNIRIESRPLQICIDFKLTNLLPICNKPIEIFGFPMYIKLKGNEQLPIFNVVFWNPINSDFERYYNCLKKLKLYIPFEYKKKVQDKTNISTCTEINYSFEDFSESCLINNVEHIEQVHYDIMQLMNIDENIFN